MIFKFSVCGDAWSGMFLRREVCNSDGSKDVLHVKMRVEITPVMIQLDQGCVYCERRIATTCFLRSCNRAFCDQKRNLHFVTLRANTGILNLLSKGSPRISLDCAVFIYIKKGVCGVLDADGRLLKSSKGFSRTIDCAPIYFPRFPS